MACVYRLRIGNTAGISLRLLSDQLIHILSPDDRLTVGNGGWSYTLTKKNSGAADASIAGSMVNSRIRAFPDSITVLKD